MVIAVISLFLLIFAVFHFYLYRKIVSAFQPLPKTRRTLTLLFTVLVVAPVINRLLDRLGLPVLSRALNFPLFIWIAWLFWFFLAGLMIDIWNRLLRWTPVGARWIIPVKIQVYSLLVLIFITTGWSLHEAYRPQVTQVVIHSPVFSQPKPLHIVQISDVHLGMLRSDEWARMICKTVESLKPDLLVSTGDLVDSSMSSIGNQADFWAAIHPPLGKLAVLGNHEYYLGLSESLSFHEKAGFRLLRQESVDVGQELTISGVDDLDGSRLGQPCFSDESLFKKRPEADRYSILLKHRPTFSEGITRQFNLQLSGHTHNGQLFPFKAIVRLNHRYTHGLYEPVPGFRLYVSSGTGTWGPPMRLFAPPEITVFILTR